MVNTAPQAALSTRGKKSSTWAYKLVICMALLVTVTMIPALPSQAASAQGYTFTEFEIVLNGKVVVAKAAKFVNDNTSYVSLYDAELLVNKILSQAGYYNKTTDVWNGNTKVWDINFKHAVPWPVANSHGTADFNLNGETVIHAPIIVTRPKGDPHPTVFVPIWYVEQILNELTGATKSTDEWNGASAPATWTISLGTGWVNTGETFGGQLQKPTTQPAGGTLPNTPSTGTWGKSL